MEGGDISAAMGAQQRIGAAATIQTDADRSRRQYSSRVAQRKRCMQNATHAASSLMHCRAAALPRLSLLCDLHPPFQCSACFVTGDCQYARARVPQRRSPSPLHSSPPLSMASALVAAAEVAEVAAPLILLASPSRIRCSYLQTAIVSACYAFAVFYLINRAVGWSDGRRNKQKKQKTKRGKNTTNGTQFKKQGEDRNGVRA